MKHIENQELFKDCLSQAVIRSWEDETFKKELINTPVSAIEELTGNQLNLKENVRMVIIDEGEPTFYFKIPSKPNFDDIELSEEQLEYVAGGGEKWEMFKAIASAVASAAWDTISRPGQFFR